MPSTMSSSVSRLLASSTVITPSLPTLAIAFARKSPISLSPFAEMVPTWAISSFEVTFLEFAFRCSTTASTARSMPRLRSIGFMPAATDLAPSRTIAWARMVAVVVPSPALSLVFEATSRTIWAPMFSNLSSSSISLATVTPSLVMRGAPKDLSSTTLRPFGPSVTFTALARMSTPRSMRSRASVENFTSLAAIESYSDWNLLRLKSWRVALGDHAHDVGLLHDQEILAVDLHLGAGPLAEQHAVAGLQVDRDQLAGLVASAGTHRQDLTFLRLLLDGIRDDDPALGLLVRLDAADDNAVMQRTELELGHVFPLWVLSVRAEKPPAPKPKPVYEKAVSTQPWRVPAAGAEIWGCAETVKRVRRAGVNGRREFQAAILPR